MKGEVKARLREEEIPETELGGIEGVVEVGVIREIGDRVYREEICRQERRGRRDDTSEV
jgi:hypothetical protein